MNTQSVPQNQNNPTRKVTINSVPQVEFQQNSPATAVQQSNMVQRPDIVQQVESIHVPIEPSVTPQSDFSVVTDGVVSPVPDNKQSSFSFSPTMWSFLALSIGIILVSSVAIYFWRQIQRDRDELVKSKQKLDNMGQLLVQHEQMIKTILSNQGNSKTPPIPPTPTHQPMSGTPVIESQPAVSAQVVEPAQLIPPKPQKVKPVKPKTKVIPATVTSTDSDDSDDSEEEEEDIKDLQKELAVALGAQLAATNDIHSDQESVNE